MNKTCFDFNDEHLYYYGSLNRETANDFLTSQGAEGSFLIRSSTTKHGDLVLCVREPTRIGHYIINVNVQNKNKMYRCGGKNYNTLGELVEDFCNVPLQDISLKAPLPKGHLRIILDHLSRSNDEIDCMAEDRVSILEYADERYKVKHANGKIGYIPKDITIQCDEAYNDYLNKTNKIDYRRSDQCSSKHGSLNLDCKRYSSDMRKVPFRVKAIRKRGSNPLDKEALTFNVGDRITVIRVSLDGTWVGTTDAGIKGHFPFNSVEILGSDQE
ncbi:Adapter molecule Crk [Intoshia linei]|uniref:Adapter molecule Crk n=1 Tax=Intoshia linei TaxID=1819745 RepID=A0A177AYZ2_9BILA|nr:Adapter molecule Crk [Intoshia linei]